MNHSGAPWFGIAAMVIGCGTDIRLGDIGGSCPLPNRCAPSDASADDAHSSNDAVPAYDSDAQTDAVPQTDSGQPIGSSQAAEAGTATDSGQIFDTGPFDSPAPPFDGGPSDGGPGGNVVGGSADGTRQFGIVSSAWWIQSPDPRVTGGPVVSTVVYLFSKPVLCAKLNVPKWDENNEPGDTQNLEIETAWSGTTEPMVPPRIDYPAVPLAHAAVPAPGTAGMFYQVTPQQPPGPPTELAATSGTVTLTGIYPNTNVTGAFAVTFAGGHTITGSFDATYCPGGREP